MKRGALFVFTLTICAFSHGYAQQPQSGVTIPAPIPALPSSPAPPTLSVGQAGKEKSLDQMLDELESLHKQKAEMEKKEQELLKGIQLKAEKQADRMKQLGIVQKAANSAPVRIGRIMIEGNEITSDDAILKMVKFRPGEVWEQPLLEQARARLMKAGFQRSEVEVSPSEVGSAYVDVLIKVIEKQK